MNTTFAPTTPDAALVSAKALEQEIGMPLRAIYRLVNKGRIPFEDVTQPWHEPGVKRIKFNVAAVRAALGMPPTGR